MSILIVNLNPTFQRTMVFDNFQIGEVNRSKQVFFDVSGKGINISRVLAQKGMKSIVLTHIGGDTSEEYIRMCKRDNIDLLYSLSNSKNRTCTTIISSTNPTELVEEANIVDSNCNDSIKMLYYSNFKDFDFIIFTGTRATGYDENIYVDFIKIAKSDGKFVILDMCKKELLNSLKYNPDIIKPNLSEFCLTFFNLVVKENETTEYLKDRVASKMKEIFELYKTTTIITRGKSNTWVYDKSGFYEIPAIRVDNPINTIGCGDTFLAALVFNLSNRVDLKKSIINATLDSAENSKTIRPGSLI